MAKILYGIMGNTRGHISRARAIMERWQADGHQFHIVGGGRVPEAFEGVWPVLEVPVLRTVHRNQGVDIPAVARQIGQRILEIPTVSRQIRNLIQTWQPDVAICDREFFLPLACKMEGLRCVTVNHSHVLLKCRYPVLVNQRISWGLAMLNDKLLFNHTRENWMVSFYHPPLKRPERDRLLPPVLRPEVEVVEPLGGSHILVYQTSPTFSALVPCLKQLKRRVIVYGLQAEDAKDGNVEFRSYHPERILEDLAGCAYAVTNGGHNLVCEALHFGKPVLCLPIRNLFEQFLNSWYIRELGYGDFSTALAPEPALFENFEKNLERYVRTIQCAGGFNGTAQVINTLRELL